MSFVEDACMSNFDANEKVTRVDTEVKRLSNSKQIGDAFEAFDDDGVFEPFCENTCHSDGSSRKVKQQNLIKVEALSLVDFAPVRFDLILLDRVRFDSAATEQFDKSQERKWSD
ncbi:hypothetical protein AKJ16_DCAP20109 [Drosera capensis]